MAKITIKNLSLTEDTHEPYATVQASIEFEKSDREYIIDAVTLDTETDEGDFELLDSFLVHWEVNANDEDMIFNVSPKVETLHKILKALVENPIEYE